MKKNTRFAFNAYLQQLARLNGVAVEELSSKFTVEPSVQQTLEDQIQQSAAFLTLINVTPVTEQSGQLLGLGVGSTIAGTTDTTAKEREPVDPTLMVDVEYKCEQTNFDTVLTYAKLDLWAKFQDFQVRIRDAIVKRQALDRIMIGFNGVKRAKTSNRSENPLLQVSVKSKAGILLHRVLCSISNWSECQRGRYRLLHAGGSPGDCLHDSACPPVR
ncbi:hypothetical protein AWF47_04025 [Escherichia coli]|nr:hypothetical protein AWF47_04025 [Escherichia coli]